MKKLLLFYSVGLFALMAPLTARAATFFVNDATGNDANTCLSAGDPCLTIEEALNKTGLTAEDDIINVAAGTYDTAGTEAIAEINSNVSIVGAGALTTIIDGLGSKRGVRVDFGVIASVSDVTIQNCSDSGTGAEGTGVLNNGTLTLDTVAVQNNVTDEGSGGGIFNGVAPGNPPATLLIMNSTISGNVANGTGGGISNGGEGIGDPNYAGNLTMVNSTVSGNTSGVNPGGDSAGGGIYNHTGSTATLFNVTIANNTANDTTGTINGGGGVNNNGGTLTINNTLLANNNDASSADANDCLGTLSSAEGHNLVEDLNGCTLGGITVGNITGVDPTMSSTLANNGGPTSTHALLSGSAAIDAGDPAGCVDNTGATQTTDQRGSTRPLAGISGGSPICDIGAFEAAAGTTPSGGGSGGCMIAGTNPSALSFGLFSLFLLAGFGVWRKKA